MVKHTQIIRRQKPTNCLIVFDHFVEFALKGLHSLPKVIAHRQTHRQAHRQIPKKRCFEKSIVHVIKHVNFQLYRAYPDGVIRKKLTIGDKYVKKDLDFLYSKQCL